MKFAIIGAGGVGGYFGGLLANARMDVTFVARGEHFKALSNRGLTLRTVDQDYEQIPVNVVQSISQLSASDVIFVSTKTYDLDEVAEEIANVTTESSIVIPLQNGIDHDIRMTKYITRGRVYPGLAYIFSTRTAPGIIEQTGGLKTILFGERKVAQNPELIALETKLRDVGVLATASEDIERELWIKFAWITTFAGITSICRSAAGPILSDEYGLDLYVQCLDETLAVAKAAGVDLSDQRAKIIERVSKFKTTESGSKASMLIDLENGRRTEIETLNGTILRLARQHNIPVPIHETIYTAVRIASAQFQIPPESRRTIKLRQI